jgi:radical SAM superfamily enzyme YgiQ (UPF0313 family)
MRVLLVSGNREDVDIRVPALGLACVAASAEAAGHEVQLLDLLISKDPETSVAKAIGSFQPDVIGVSVRNIDDQRMRNPKFLLEQAREAVGWCRASSRAPIVLGGAGFSILPGPILEYLGADMGIQGEGEALFPELLKRMQERGNLEEMPGLFLKGNVKAARRTFTRDLDSLPLPDPSLLARSLSGAKEAPVPVQTRRGCPLSCSYCSTPTIEGKMVRRRSPEAAISWIARWVEEGFHNFYFVDNTFNLPPSFAMNICSKILAAGLDISWRCILFPGTLDPKLAELLQQSGCREVSIGFESGAEDMLHRMRKQYALGEVRRTCDLLRQHHIRRMGFLLLGGPGETRKSVEASLSFAEHLDLDALKVSIGVRIYPDTDVSRQAMKEGLIDSYQDLLKPTFYLAKDVEGWIYEEVARRASLKPNWSF